MAVPAGAPGAVRFEQRPEVGTVVHLRPATPTAGRFCQRFLPARVLHYRRWPLVYLELTTEPHQQFYTHADNCGLHPHKAAKNQGDQARAIVNRKVKPPMRPHPPLDLRGDWSEPTLFDPEEKPDGERLR